MNQLPARRVLPLIYLIYVPLRHEFNVLSSPDFKAMQDMVVPNEMHVVYSSLNYEKLDEAVTRFEVDRVVSHIHKRELYSFDRIWIGGRGSSAFAREVIHFAYDCGISVVDHTPPGSTLGRCNAWFRHKAAQEAYVVAEQHKYFG